MRRFLPSAVLVAVVLGGCDFPADPEGTQDVVVAVVRELEGALRTFSC